MADVFLFWLLNAPNSAEPVLSELHQEPAPSGAALTANWPGRPAVCWTFSLNIIWKQSPATDMPRQSRYSRRCFVPLDGVARSQPRPRGDRHRLEQAPTGDLAGQATRRAAARGADFICRCALHPLTSQEPLSAACKAGSHDDVAEVVNTFLSGIAIKPLSQAGGHSPRLETNIFALDLSTDAARAMLEAGTTFYTPNRLAIET
ncbi:type VI secretion system baseplate subunit TssK [Klebsiella pneumoniae]|nr:type VI secretion system baseplate subunit TssK [Klebsiella pneumoniae]